MKTPDGSVTPDGNKYLLQSESSKKNGQLTMIIHVSVNGIQNRINNFQKKSITNSQANFCQHTRLIY